MITSTSACCVVVRQHCADFFSPSPTGKILGVIHHYDRPKRKECLSVSIHSREWRTEDPVQGENIESGTQRTRATKGGNTRIPAARARSGATPSSRQPGAECSGDDATCSTSADRAVYTTFRNSHNQGGGTMPHHHELEELGSLVDRTETQRTIQNTTALQEYLDKHPQLSAITLSMTDEVKQRLVLYMGNADKTTQEKLQGELDELGRHLANLSEKPNMLHQLLCEEVLLS